MFMYLIRNITFKVYYRIIMKLSNLNFKNKQFYLIVLLTLCISGCYINRINQNDIISSSEKKQLIKDKDIDNNNRIKKITTEIKQPFAGSQSPDSAIKAAIAKAKYEALEKAGTFIESVMHIENGQITKADVLAIASGILSVNKISQERYHTQDSFGIKVKAEVLVDTSILNDRINNFYSNNKLLNLYKKKLQQEKRLLERIEKLQTTIQELSKYRKNSTIQNELNKEFYIVSKELSNISEKKYGNIHSNESISLSKNQINKFCLACQNVQMQYHKNKEDFYVNAWVNADRTPVFSCFKNGNNNGFTRIGQRFKVLKNNYDVFNKGSWSLLISDNDENLQEESIIGWVNHESLIFNNTPKKYFPSNNFVKIIIKDGNLNQKNMLQLYKNPLLINPKKNEAIEKGTIFFVYDYYPRWSGSPNNPNTKSLFISSTSFLDTTTQNNPLLFGWITKCGSSNNFSASSGFNFFISLHDFFIP